jgi:hypothetical protein
MSSSLKGALLSGLVFPGLGQIVLRRYMRGIVLMFICLASLIVITVTAAQQAIPLIEKLETMGAVIDMKAISSAATQVSTTSDNYLVNIASFLIVVCWVIGILDAYNIGKKIDRENLESQG